jgi:hypothetical protein
MYGKDKKPIIYASEIGQYHFCPVAWYLQKCGYTSTSPQINSGRRKHDAYGIVLQKRRTSQILSKVILIGGILGVFLSILLLFYEAML